MLNSSFDLCDFIEQVWCWAARINERLMLAQKFVSQLAIAGDSPRFDQRDPFPGFAETRVIIFHAFERAGEWTSRTFRAQAKIDPEKRAFRVADGKRFQNFFGQSIEPLMIRESRRELAFFAVEKDKIDIGAVI